MNATVERSLFGDYLVDFDAEADADAGDDQWVVYDAEMSVWDTFATRAEAVEAAKAQAREEEAEGLRDEAECLLMECDDPAKLRAILAILNG